MGTILTLLRSLTTSTLHPVLWPTVLGALMGAALAFAYRPARKWLLMIITVVAPAIIKIYAPHVPALLIALAAIGIWDLAVAVVVVVSDALDALRSYTFRQLIWRRTTRKIDPDKLLGVDCKAEVQAYQDALRAYLADPNSWPQMDAMDAAEYRLHEVAAASPITEWLVASCIDGHGAFAEEALQVLAAFPASLRDVYALAKAEGWCKEWDHHVSLAFRAGVLAAG